MSPRLSEVMYLTLESLCYLEPVTLYNYKVNKVT